MMTGRVVNSAIAPSKAAERRPGPACYAPAGAARAGAGPSMIGAMAALIGTSGWSYDHWEGVLYPPGTPPRERLAHYVPRYRTVEVNSTYYRWPSDAAFASWR